MHYFFRFINHFHFFIREAIFLENINLRNRIKSNLMLYW